MERNKAIGEVVAKIADVITQEIESTNALENQQFNINVAHFRNCKIISADLIDMNFCTKVDHSICDPEVIVTGDIQEVIQEIIPNRSQ